jgi:hypothetical protein
MAIAKSAEKAPVRLESHPAGASFEELYKRQRAELDRLIDQRVEPFRKKIKELEQRRADIDEELKHLYMVVGGYEQGLKGNALPLAG